jgi:hypothetical protein
MFSLRDFLRLSTREKVPDHSWLSRTRSRLPHEAHETVFGWVLMATGHILRWSWRRAGRPTRSPSRQRLLDPACEIATRSSKNFPKSKEHLY